jgi:hypothetical protein
MDLVTALGRTIPFALASGINLYATVAVLGLVSRYGLVDLPASFRGFDHPVIIGVALAMYVIEFAADKIPWVDSVWDTVHTVVRPLGGAIVAVTALGESSVVMQSLVALLAGGVAMTTHLSKAGTRAVANTSPEPFSNWLLSIAEDIFAIAFSYVALQHPYMALLASVMILTIIVMSASLLYRAVRRRLHQS